MMVGALWLAPAVAWAQVVPVPDTTTTTSASTTTSTTAPASVPTVVPETKILTVEPAPTTTTTTRPAPRPSTPAPTVRSDSPALRALVEATATERRRLAGEVADAEARVAGMEAALAAARDGLSSEEARVAALEVDVARARAGVEGAAALVARLEASATTAAEVVQSARTPVARPPAPGHTPRDAAVQARQALDAAVASRRDAVATQLSLQKQLEQARQGVRDKSSELAARVAELGQARDVLEGLRRQLVAAEQATPSVEGAGGVVLVPAPSSLASSTIPAGWLPLYARGAATCPGLPWPVLAAVGSVESAHGQTTAAGVRDGANFAGAMGPMQFLAGTWAAYSVDGDDDGVRNVYDPDDAVFGAARYLCASGGANVETLRSALWAYNHADWYVEMVLELAAKYAG